FSPDVLTLPLLDALPISSSDRGDNGVHTNRGESLKGRRPALLTYAQTRGCPRTLTSRCTQGRSFQRGRRIPPFGLHPIRPLHGLLSISGAGTSGPSYRPELRRKNRDDLSRVPNAPRASLVGQGRMEIPRMARLRAPRATTKRRADLSYPLAWDRHRALRRTLPWLHGHNSIHSQIAWWHR